MRLPIVTDEDILREWKTLQGFEKAEYDKQVHSKLNFITNVFRYHEEFIMQRERTAEEQARRISGLKEERLGKKNKAVDKFITTTGNVRKIFVQACSLWFLKRMEAHVLDRNAFFTELHVDHSLSEPLAFLYHHHFVMLNDGALGNAVIPSTKNPPHETVPQAMALSATLETAMADVEAIRTVRRTRETHLNSALESVQYPAISRTRKENAFENFKKADLENLQKIFLDFRKERGFREKTLPSFRQEHDFLNAYRAQHRDYRKQMNENEDFEVSIEKGLIMDEKRNMGKELDEVVERVKELDNVLEKVIKVTQESIKNDPETFGDAEMEEKFENWLQTDRGRMFSYFLKRSPPPAGDDRSKRARHV
jgi:hypothetical protein